jgi:hypothetical protein
MAEPARERVKKWLEETIENSEKAVDRGWEVSVSDDDPNVMLIDTEQMPFRLTVLAGDKITYIALVTSIELEELDNDKLGPALRDLMKKSKEVDLVKFCIMDPSDTLMLRADLYSNYMSKNEFNMALESVILGGRWLIAQLGQTEEGNKLVKEMEELGSVELITGTPGPEVVQMMVKAGMEEEDAMSLVVKLKEVLGLEVTDEDTTIYTEVPKEMPKQKKAASDNPVDRYIW